MRFRLLLAAQVLGVVFASCGNSDEGATTKPGADGGIGGESALHGLPKGAEQLARICARKGGDLPSTVLCGPTPPAIHSLGDLQRALGLGFAVTNAAGENASGGNPGFTLTAQSASLAIRSVSAINPRAFIFTPSREVKKNDRFVALAFARGEQTAEIAAFDPTARGGQGQLKLYLVAYQQACNAKGHCSPADTLTPATEAGWTEWSLYEAEDLIDTVFDCAHCHQRGGPESETFLRFHERQTPWTHYLRDNTPGGQALLADFHAAHGLDEDYGGIPAALIARSDPQQLQNLVDHNGYADQPNEFPSQQIEDEVKASNAAQPESNMPPGTSATWDKLFEVAVSGGAIPVPYHDVKCTDPAKLAAMTNAYTAFKQSGGALPDIRDVFLDSALPKMGIRPRTGATGAGILVQICQQCHNEHVTPASVRSLFDVTKLSTMSRSEKDKAIARLRLPLDDPKHMPSAKFFAVTDEERELVISELSK
jgi:hypothetical protein